MTDQTEKTMPEHKKCPFCKSPELHRHAFRDCIVCRNCGAESLGPDVPGLAEVVNIPAQPTMHTLLRMVDVYADPKSQPAPMNAVYADIVAKARSVPSGAAQGVDVEALVNKAQGYTNDQFKQEPTNREMRPLEWAAIRIAVDYLAAQGHLHPAPEQDGGK